MVKDLSSSLQDPTVSPKGSYHHQEECNRCSSHRKYHNKDNLLDRCRHGSSQLNKEAIMDRPLEALRAHCTPAWIHLRQKRRGWMLSSRKDCMRPE